MMSFKKLISATCISVAAVLPVASHAVEPLVLWYRAPAARWIDALALGNGRLGAMVFGGPAQERIGLNEDTVWSGGPYEPSVEAAPEVRQEIQRLMFSGDYKGAQELCAKLQGNPKSQASYQTVGELTLDFPGHETFSNYRRQLDLETALVTITYKSNGTNYTREILSSPVDQVIAIRLTADQPGKLTFDVTQHSPLQVAVKAGEANEVSMIGRNGDMLNREKVVVLKGALTFESRVRVLAEGGKIAPDGEKVHVEGANAATLYLAAATSYQHYNDVSGDPVARCSNYLAAACQKSYETLKRDHIAEHQRLFKRVTLDLGRTPAADLPTDERLQAFSTQDDPALVALYFQFGRYLLMSSSRPGSQPANLQGIWNDKLFAPWGGKYTVNINTEMNYWPAQVTNLVETEEPLFRMVSEVALDAGVRTAQRTYNAPGWILHHNTDLWRPAAPIDSAFYGQWQTGGVWLTNQLYEAYLFSLDRAYLQKLYPMMKGAALFFKETLVKEPEHGWLVTLPSNSPENSYEKGLSVTYGPSMDMQLLRDLFGNCIEASQALDCDADLRATWKGIREQLAPNQIGKGGQLQEWIKDWDLTAPDRMHRHMSPFYGVYPGHDITPADPKIFAAARKLAEMRGSAGMGWANAWRIGIWARLLDSQKAYSFLQLMLTNWTEMNMFDRPATQLDGNFGATGAIAEMLLQTHAGEINLLPALPATKWPNGSVSGLRARGGFEVAIEWKDGKLASAVLRNVSGTRAKIRYQEKTIEISCRPGDNVTLDGALERR